MSLSDPRWCKRRKFISQLQYDHAKQRFCELFPHFSPNNSRDMVFYSLDPNIESKENKAKLFPPRQFIVCSDAMLQAVPLTMLCLSFSAALPGAAPPPPAVVAAAPPPSAVVVAAPPPAAAAAPRVIPAKRPANPFAHLLPDSHAKRRAVEAAATIHHPIWSRFEVDEKKGVVPG